MGKLRSRETVSYGCEAYRWVLTLVLTRISHSSLGGEERETAFMIEKAGEDRFSFYSFSAFE